MGIVESIKKGFALAKKSMDLVLALFVFGAVWNLVNISLMPNVQDPQAPVNPATAMILMVLGIVFIFLSIFVQAGSLGYVRDKIKSGNAALAVFFADGRKYYGRILLVGAMIGLVVGLFAVLAAVLAAVLSAFTIVAAILAVALIVIGVYFGILMFFAPYLVVVDGKSPLDAVKQSVTLVRKNLLAVLGVAGLLILAGFAVGLGLGGAFAGVNLVLKGVVPQILFAVISSFINAFLGVTVTSAFMHLYLGISNNTSGAK